jgi:hypothetical protein
VLAGELHENKTLTSPTSLKLAFRENAYNRVEFSEPWPTTCSLFLRQRKRQMNWYICVWKRSFFEHFSRGKYDLGNKKSEWDRVAVCPWCVVLNLITYEYLRLASMIFLPQQPLLEMRAFLTG